MTSGTGTSITASTDILLRAGEKVRIYMAGRINTGDELIVRVTNENAQRALNSSGVWTATGAKAASITSGTWVDSYVDFTMPDAEELGHEWATVSVLVGCTASLAATLDCDFEVKMVVGWDFLGVFGHGSTKYWAPRFQYTALTGNDPGDAMGTWATPSWDRSTTGYDVGGSHAFPPGDLHQPALYNYLSSIRYERWCLITPWSEIAGETPPAAQGFGEVVLGQTRTMNRNPDYPFTLTAPFRGQYRNETRAGDVYIYNPSRYPARQARWFVTPRTSDAAELEEVRYLMHQAAQGGRYPMILLPIEVYESEAIYGSLAEAMTISRPQYGYSTVELALNEYPMPDLRIVGV
jgi:hypothetical protein